MEKRGMEMRDNGRAAIGLLLSSVFFLVGCSTSVKQPGLIGHYRFASKHATFELNLKPDGTFEQVISIPQSKTRSNTGTWHWDDRFRVLILNNAMEIDSHGEPGVRLDVSAVPVVKTFGMIRLEIDPDSDYEYRKK